MKTWAANIPSTSLLFSATENKFSQVKDFSKRTFSKNSNFKPPVSPKILLILVGILFIGGIVLLIKNTQPTNATLNTNEKPLAPVIKERVVLNKEFKFPIKDANNKELSKIKYMIEAASLQDEILVKGQRARAVKGRTFLILDLKITNSFNQGIQINSKDYVRLKKAGSDDLTAADIHNDPVEVQAISTKTTRIGFPINETDKNMEIQVGEINGKKETIKFSF